MQIALCLAAAVRNQAIETKPYDICQGDRRENMWNFSVCSPLAEALPVLIARINPSRSPIATDLYPTICNNFTNNGQP